MIRFMSGKSSISKQFLLYLGLAVLLVAFGRHASVHAQPLSAADRLAQLQGQLQAAIDASGLDVTVAVTDLQTNETTGVGGDQLRLSACAINLLVLIQSTIDMSLGQIPFDTGDQLIASTIYGSNPVTARELLFMIGNDDLTAGIGRINALAKSIGVGIYYDHPPAFADDAPNGGDNYVRADDMNKVLAALWQGRILNDEWRDYLLKKLTGVKPGLQYLIPAGVGDGVVSHKNGFVWTALGWADNDVGIVSFRSGGQTYAYAISYFANWVPEEYGDINVGQRVSRLAWSYFQDLYSPN